MNYYLTSESYDVVYSHPITLKKNDLVILTKKKVEDNPEWAGWVWCQSADNEGWIPIQITQHISDQTYLITEDYTAKELSVVANEQVIGIKELNGWMWCKKKITNEVGWLPKNILTPDL